LDQPAKTGNELKSATLNSHGTCLKVIDTFRQAIQNETHFLDHDVAARLEGNQILQAMQISLQVHGKKGPDTRDLLVSQASALFQVGDRAGALTLAQLVTEVCRNRRQSLHTSPRDAQKGTDKTSQNQQSDVPLKKSPFRRPATRTDH